MEHVFCFVLFSYTDFTACLHGMSPLLIKLKSSSVQPSTTNCSHAKYEKWSNQTFTVMPIRPNWMNLGLYIFIYIFSSSHRVQSHLLPLYCTFHTCLLTILSSSAPLLSSHSHSPLLLLSYWSVANSIKRYLSIAWLLGSINTGTSPN